MELVLIAAIAGLTAAFIALVIARAYALDVRFERNERFAERSLRKFYQEAYYRTEKMLIEAEKKLHDNGID